MPWGFIPDLVDLFVSVTITVRINGFSHIAGIPARNGDQITTQESLEFQYWNPHEIIFKWHTAMRAEIKSIYWRRNYLRIQLKLFTLFLCRNCYWVHPPVLQYINRYGKGVENSIASSKAIFSLLSDFDDNASENHRNRSNIQQI